MSFAKIVRYLFYLIGVIIFVALIILFAKIFGGKKSIIDYYLSWRLIFIFVFYLVSLVVMEFLYNKVNKWLLKKSSSS